VTLAPRRRACDAIAVLREARARGIHLTPDGAVLRVKGPVGALDALLRDALVAHKPEILRLLAGPQIGEDGGPVDQCAVCGCPIWWRAASGIWRCDQCEPRTDAVCRIFVVAGGEWAKH
jgi:TubC N-terminal docking domain